VSVFEDPVLQKHLPLHLLCSTTTASTLSYRRISAYHFIDRKTCTSTVLTDKFIISATRPKIVSNLP